MTTTIVALSAGAKAVIINKLGVVHRVYRNGTAACPIVAEVERGQRREVTPLQCRVYSLPCCRVCWMQSDFDQFLGALR